MNKDLFQVLIIIGIVVLAWYCRPSAQVESSPTLQNLKIPQTRLQSASLLLNINGTPEEYGYATHPLKIFNEESLGSWQMMRLKKWDRFNVITDRFSLSVSITDVFFVGEVRLTFWDFDTQKNFYFAKLLNSDQTPYLSPTSYQFTGEYEDDNFIVEVDDFTLKIENSQDQRHIFVSYDTQKLELNLTMTKSPKQEAMVAVIPLDQDKQYFFYTMKMPNLESKGRMKVGNNEYLITRKDAGGFIDWGRGVWPYRTFWRFARAQGFLKNGKRIGLSFGSGYGDFETNEATEDAFFIDDLMIKLNSVQIDRDLFPSWKIRTIGTSKKFLQCEIDFIANFEENLDFNLYIIKNNIKTVYGKYTGWVTDGMNNKYEFTNLNGYIQIHQGKW